MRTDYTNYIQLEINDTIRKKCKYLCDIENLIATYFHKYKFLDIKYDENSYHRYYSVDLVLETFKEKNIEIYLSESSDGNIYIDFYRINNKKFNKFIILLDFLDQRDFENLTKYIEDNQRIKNDDNTIENVKTFLMKIIEIFSIEEMDKLLHTDYWADDIWLNWRRYY